jgi:hypothetical protein
MHVIASALRVPIAFFTISLAEAQTVIDFDNINYSTPEGLANFVRYQYLSVNGDTSEYSSGNGMPEGWVGLANSILGADGLGGALHDLGYSTCNSIPSSGSKETSTDSDTISMTFSAGTKTIPSHFGSSGGQAYDKRVGITVDGNLAMNVELKCSADNSFISAYIVMNNNLVEGGALEIYTQSDSSTSSSYLDFFLDMENGYKLATRFVTADGSDYRLYQASWDGTNGFAYAIQGAANGVSNVNVIHCNHLVSAPAVAVVHDISAVIATPLGAAYNGCLNMSGNQTSTGCSSITAPGTFTMGPGANFSIAGIAALSASAVTP